MKLKALSKCLYMVIPSLVSQATFSTKYAFLTNIVDTLMYSELKNTKCVKYHKKLLFILISIVYTLMQNAQAHICIKRI